MLVNKLGVNVLLLRFCKSFQSDNYVYLESIKHNLKLITRNSTIPGGHSITKHTGGWLGGLSQKPPKYLSKNSDIKKC